MMVDDASMISSDDINTKESGCFMDDLVMGGLGVGWTTPVVKRTCILSASEIHINGLPNSEYSRI